MKSKILYLASSVAFLASMFFAVTSANASWLFTTYQRECPKCLIKQD